MGTPEDGVPALRQASGEPLSARELDVLRLLATDLDGPEITRELVSNRRAAIRRAEELELVPPS